MPEPADLDTLIYKLKKRGFKQDDVLLHECVACKEMGVLIFTILGRSGGRDIRLCVKCGDARSFRNSAGMEAREEDPSFDLRTFLR